MDYKQKLIEFNSTQKYKDELLFLHYLVNGYGEKLDIGCGIGTACEFIGADGYDVNNYIDFDNSNYFEQYINYFDRLPDRNYEHVYFMHSIAHIPDIVYMLKLIKAMYNPTVTVITPNKDWLDPDYNNDPTVIKHYNQVELAELFKECGYEVTLIGQFGELKNGINERIFLQAI